MHVEDADVLVGEISGVLLHQRNEVAPHDGDRHRPIGIEIDLDDFAVDLGRRPVRLADHRGVAADGHAVLDRLDLRRRNIADDVTVGQMAGQAAQPYQISLELREPNVARDIEPVEALRAHNAVHGDAVAGLEAANRRFDIGVEDIGGAGGGFEIAGDDQPLAQRHHARVAIAEPQTVRRRNFRPAAARQNSFILRDRLCGGLHRRR